MSSVLAINTAEDATTLAKSNTLLTPRFYRTNNDAFDKIDLEPVRREFDALVAEFGGDSNRNHFERNAEFSAQIRELPPALRQEFLDFLVSSVTAEFSGSTATSSALRRARTSRT